ncbi:putative quinol monooxygenase [Flexibacterium corallicola]|uniref:putative quinol monooxygenase n=1 Tax=Flexibacterium corallicola TaxID=3037259 RepID=UPI00286F3599|nr:hypothetical protein [Pseudovibrio sp. M1P-2-3]
MTTLATLQMKVQPGAYGDLEHFLKDNLQRTRGFAGALNINIYYDAETSNFMLLEEWLARDHHQAYIDYISKHGIMEQLLQFMQGPPTVTYYERAVL